MDKMINFLENFSGKFFAIIKQLLMVLLYFILVISIQISFRSDLTNSNFLIANLSNIFAELLVLLCFIFIFRKKVVPDFNDFKINGKQYIKQSFVYWFLGLIVMIISNLIISNMIGMSTNEQANQNLLSSMPIYAFAAMVIIAPITEELLTRIILKDKFNNIYICSILSGLIFGGLHLLAVNSLAEIWYIIPYGVLGFAFALMYNP